MPSDVDIANLALVKLGDLRIVSFSDNVKPARSINAIYATERDNELRAHNWSFSIKRTSIPALSAVPAFGYNLAYQLPDDCLRVLAVGDFAPADMVVPFYNTSTDNPDYRIEGKTIVTNMKAPLNLRYIARVSDPNLFDPSFVHAFALRLAMELAEDLTGNTSKRQVAQQEYKQAITEALRANAIEDPPEELSSSTWLTSRLPGV